MKMIAETEFKQTEVGSIPVDWEVGSLEEISEEVTDGSHFSPEESSEGDKIIATVKDMRYNGFSFERSKRIRSQDFDRLVKDGCSPRRGDILISKDGANCLDLIFVYAHEEKIVVLSSIAIVRLKPGFDPLFYRYFLLSPIAQEMMREGYVTGSAIPRVVLKDLKRVPVPMPPFEAQERIAKVFQALDAKIELNRRMDKALEEIGKAVFKHWFIDFEFPTEEGKPYKSSGGEMVYNKELGKEIPKGWEARFFSEVIAVNPNRELPARKLSKKVGMADLKPWQASIPDWSSEEYKSGPRFRNGDTLFARITPSLEHGKTALVSFLNDDEVGFGSTEFIVFAKKVVSSKVYIFHLARSPEIRTIAINAMTGSSGRQRVPNEVLDFLPIAVPPASVEDQFERTCSPLFERISINSKNAKILSKIRDSLLPKLMSGKIRVPVEVR